jgi:hypothetical protein
MSLVQQIKDQARALVDEVLSTVLKRLDDLEAEVQTVKTKVDDALPVAQPDAKPKGTTAHAQTARGKGGAQPK